ncbi:hypothetical protein [Acinetobacter sp. ESBL14]
MSLKNDFLARHQHLKKLKDMQILLKKQQRIQTMQKKQYYHPLDFF